MTLQDYRFKTLEHKKNFPFDIWIYEKPKNFTIFAIPKLIEFNEKQEIVSYNLTQIKEYNKKLNSKIMIKEIVLNSFRKQLEKKGEPAIKILILESLENSEEITVFICDEKGKERKEKRTKDDFGFLAKSLLPKLLIDVKKKHPTFVIMESMKIQIKFETNEVKILTEFHVYDSEEIQNYLLKF